MSNFSIESLMAKSGVTKTSQDHTNTSAVPLLSPPPSPQQLQQMLFMQQCIRMQLPLMCMQQRARMFTPKPTAPPPPLLAAYQAAMQQLMTATLPRSGNTTTTSPPSLAKVTTLMSSPQSTASNSSSVLSSTTEVKKTTPKQETADGQPKSFVCPDCGKVFNAHYNLTRHMPVHTGARPFICKVKLLHSFYH